MNSTSHHDLYSFLFHWRLVIGSSAHPNQRVHSIGLKILRIKTCFITVPSFRKDEQGFEGIIYLYKLPQLCICGIMCDEESQTVVFNLHWRWSVHFAPKKICSFIKRKTLSYN